MSEDTMPERWVLYAGLSAVFAAAVAILGKAGLRNVDPMVATIVRSIVMTVFLAAVGTAFGAWSKLPALREAGGKGVALVALSGIAGAMSWLFYFNALRLADASKVASIDKLSVPIAVLLAVLLLGERPSTPNWIGIGLVVIGAYLIALPK
jgi:transporter family protein